MASNHPAIKHGSLESESTASPSNTSKPVAPEPRFNYTGNALAAQAQITRLEDQELDKLKHIRTVAPAVLSSTGGRSRGKSLKPREPRFLAFGSADSLCEGRQMSSGTFVTRVKATLTDVKLGRRMTAALLHAELIARRSPEQRLPEASLANTKIEGMRLDEYDVEVTLSTSMLAWPKRWDRLKEAYLQDEEFRQRHGHQFFAPAGARQRGLCWPAKSGYVTGTIVEKISTRHPEAVIEGNTITLPNYGKLYLGEIVMKEDAWRLTLVRGKLGSPEAGDASLCAVESNGKQL